MRFLIALTLIAASSLGGSPIAPAVQPPGEPGEIVVLQDYLWVPVIVHRTPTAVNCHFEVVNGRPTVHAELLSEHDFSLFLHNREYDALAQTESARSGGFERMIETPGRYRVLIRNDQGAPPVAVSLTIRTDVDPQPAALSMGVSPQRRLGVIAMSLGLFLGTVLWSGRRLLRAWHNRETAVHSNSS